jgi:hypothetical protein
LSVTIQPNNRYALKEWAVVVQALASGRQTLLFRKGGLIEDRGEFSVKHTEFFIYPTYLHEQAERIVPDAAKDLETDLQSRPPEDRVILSLYGVVQESIVVNDPRKLEALRPYHILSLEEVENRFYYRDRPGLHVLLLRVYRVPDPFELPVTPAYAGCRSWVDLDLELSTAGCQPVLSDKSFNEQIQVLRSNLK